MEASLSYWQLTFLFGKQAQDSLMKKKKTREGMLKQFEKWRRRGLCFK